MKTQDLIRVLKRVNAKGDRPTLRVSEDRIEGFFRNGRVYCAYAFGRTLDTASVVYQGFGTDGESFRQTGTRNEILTVVSTVAK